MTSRLAGFLSCSTCLAGPAEKDDHEAIANVQCASPASGSPLFRKRHRAIVAVSGKSDLRVFSQPVGKPLRGPKFHVKQLSIANSRPAIPLPGFEIKP